MNTLPSDTPIYRYISFDRFLQMVFSRQIAAVSPSKWKDTYEQYWLHWLESPEGEAQLKNYIKKSIDKADDIRYVEKQVKGLQKIICKNIFAICFTIYPDNELMWRANSVDTKTIMFCTTIQAMKTLAEKNGFSDTHVVEVQYDLENCSSFENYLGHLNLYNRNVMISDGYEFFTHKRRLFDYEKEVRFILSPDELLTEEKNLIDLHIDDLTSFISGIMVHPGADKEYVELIKLLCERYGLKFMGRSKIYDFAVL